MEKTQNSARSLFAVTNARPNFSANINFCLSKNIARSLVKPVNYKLHFTDIPLPLFNVGWTSFFIRFVRISDVILFKNTMADFLYQCVYKRASSYDINKVFPVFYFLTSRVPTNAPGFLHGEHKASGGHKRLITLRHDLLSATRLISTGWIEALNLKYF